MAHYAEIVNNKVVRVLVMDNQMSDAECTAFLNKNVSSNPWVRTSYSGSIRGKFAGIGDEYHPDLDAFIAPKPHKSWKLNKRTKKYSPPKRKPKLKSDEFAEWNEASKSWTVRGKPRRSE